MATTPILTQVPPADLAGQEVPGNLFTEAEKEARKRQGNEARSGCAFNIVKHQQDRVSGTEMEADLKVTGGGLPKLCM